MATIVYSQIIHEDFMRSSWPGTRKACRNDGETRKSNIARVFPIKYLILIRKALVSENVSAKFQLRFTGRLDRELASHSRRSVTGLISPFYEQTSNLLPISSNLLSTHASTYGISKGGGRIWRSRMNQG